jgi:predicted AAA+ superfamily ATPase
MPYIKRKIEERVISISEHFPVLLITGPRQVGKTTMLKKIAEEGREYVTLDSPMIRELAKTDPELFLQRYKPPIIIDEIQYAPELLPYIKMYVDEHKEKGSFWLTGSQMFHMMKNVSESLAGRVGILNMLGLSYGEIIGDTNEPFSTNAEYLIQASRKRQELELKKVYNQIFKGGMPALYEVEQELDIRDLSQVGDELTFFKFIVSVAARTGQQLNMTELSRDAGVSNPTIKQWLSILVSSGIVYLLEPYYNNTLKRLVKSPKVYFMDTGLCSYLTKWMSAEALETGAMSGAIFETWVISEILKGYYNAGKRPPLFYYRDKDQQEVDLVIWENNTLYPVEIKKSANPGKEAIKNFKALEKTKLEIGTGGVICLTKDILPIDKNNWYIPVKVL